MKNKDYYLFMVLANMTFLLIRKNTISKNQIININGVNTTTLTPKKYKWCEYHHFLTAQNASDTNLKYAISKRLNPAALMCNKQKI